MYRRPVLRSLIRFLGLGKLPTLPDMLDMVHAERRWQATGHKPTRVGSGQVGTPKTSLAWLRRYQKRRLLATVRYCYTHIPAYRARLDAAGVRPEDVQSLEDIQKLPLLDRTDFQENETGFISRAPGVTPAIPFHTSGTSGKSLNVYLSPKEFEFYSSAQALGGLLGQVLGPQEILQTHLPVDVSPAAHLLTQSAIKAGTLVINTGFEGTLKEHLDSLFEERHIPGKRSRVSLMYVSPAYLWALINEAERLGIDLHQSGLRHIMTGGAKVSPELRERVRASFGLHLNETYAMVEITPFAAHECSHGVMHFNELAGMVEVLHPETRQPVPPGELGVAVLTTFYPLREVTPLLRYWTKDLVRIDPTPGCGCGNPATRLLEVAGRSDHMIIVGAANWYPQRIGDALLKFTELVRPPRFSVRVVQEEDAQYAYLDVEMKTIPEPDEAARLSEAITASLDLNQVGHYRLGAFKFKVTLRPPNSIAQPFAYKAPGLGSG